MRTMTMLAATGAAALVAGCMTDEEPELTAEAQSELAAELAGYSSAGPPVSCVRMRDLQGNRSAAGDVVIFSGSGSRLWVNRARGGCPLNDGRALRFQTTQTQLCSGDIATVFDPVSGVEYGGCTLGEFEPSRRTR